MRTVSLWNFEKRPKWLVSKQALFGMYKIMLVNKIVRRINKIITNKLLHILGFVLTDSRKIETYSLFMIFGSMCHWQKDRCLNSYVDAISRFYFNGWSFFLQIIRIRAKQLSCRRVRASSSLPQFGAFIFQRKMPSSIVTDVIDGRTDRRVFWNSIVDAISRFYSKMLFLMDEVFLCKS